MKKLLILIVMLNFTLIASNNTTSKISIDKTNTIYASQVKKEQGKSKFMANVLENWKNKYEILSLKNENLLATIEDEEEKLSYLKWVYGFLLAVAGFLGYREYSKFVDIRKETR